MAPIILLQYHGLVHSMLEAGRQEQCSKEFEQLRNKLKRNDLPLPNPIYRKIFPSSHFSHIISTTMNYRHCLKKGSQHMLHNISPKLNTTNIPKYIIYLFFFFSFRHTKQREQKQTNQPTLPEKISAPIPYPSLAYPVNHTPHITPQNDSFIPVTPKSSG